MTQLSKEDRKRLRREAEHLIRHEDVFATIVSPKATIDDAGPAQVLAEGAKVGVRLGHRRIDDMTHTFGVPDHLDTLSVVLGYGVIDEDFLQPFKSRNEQQLSNGMGCPSITFRGKARLDRAIDFIGMTVLRALGRLTHGVLVDGSNLYVNSDWLAWSLDYMDPNMFKVTRVYDNPPPDFRSLADRFPQLKA